MGFRSFLSLVTLGLVACSSPATPAASAPARAVASADSSATIDPPLPSASSNPPAPVVDVCPVLDVPLPSLIEVGADPQVPAIEASADAMATLYEKLAKLARGKRDDHVRIAMYGDSNLTSDHVSGELRRALQAQWGDGGHGFHALARPWPGYVHHDIRAGSDGWKGFNCTTDQLVDRMYGFGCIASQSQHGNARTWIESAPDDAPVGRSFSRFEVAYLTKPKAHGFDVLVDGAAKGGVDTHGDRAEVGFHKVELSEGSHRVEIVSRSMDVRLLGGVIERKSPGVVVDGLGIGGADTEHILRTDERVADATLRWRKYDLVILFTGAIEPDSAAHAAALEKFIDRHRASLPDTPILITGPVDMAQGTEEKPTANPRIDHVLAEKRRVANEKKAAYWDFRTAMGGPLSIVKFAGKKMAWTDFIHLTDKGGTYMGRRLAYALVMGLRGYLKEHPKAGCSSQ